MLETSLAERNSTIPKRLTSVKVIIFFPHPFPPNLTFLTHQPGALELPLVHSYGSSESQPLEYPVPVTPQLLLAEGYLVLSVWKTFRGFVLRTSHTATTPSWEATAYFVPSGENAELKEPTNDGDE